MRSTFALLLLLAGCGGSGNGAADGGVADLAMAAGPDMIVLVNGCPSYTAPLAKPGDPIDGDTWATFAQGFFAGYCTSCHSTTATNRNGAPAGYDWDDEASVRAHLAMIRDAVGVGNYMPPLAPLPACDARARLVRWIDADAP